MTPKAILFMVLFWAVVWTACGYCFYRVFTSDRHLGGGEE
jgi:hypothetical protein